MRGKTFRTLDDAKAFQRDHSHAIQHGTYIAPEKTATKWATVRDEWLRVHQVRIKPRTLNGYRCMLGLAESPSRTSHFARWDNRPIGNITRMDVRDLRDRVEKAGLKEETEHRIFNVANAILTFAVQEGYIKTNPATAVRKELRSVKRKTFKAYTLTLSEAQRIIDNLPDGRFRLFGLVGLWTGCRAGELAGLRVRNIDRLRNLVQVEGTVQDLNGTLSAGTTKTDGSASRRIPVPRAVMEQIGQHIDSNRLGPDEYLFAGSSEFFHYQNFRNRQWLPAVKAAGPYRDGKPLVRFHDLRHTFATLRAMQGVPPHVLKNWMGHADITTTMNIYSHVYDGDPRMEALVERLYGGDAGFGQERLVAPRDAASTVARP